MKRSRLTDPAEWRRVRALFDAALERPPADRGAFLAESCGDDAELRAEVLELLNADAALEREETELVASGGASFLEPTLESIAPLFSVDADPEGDDPNEAEPPLPFLWGPLQVEERIGAGSFGRVYRAHDAALRRDVALKLRRVDPSGRTEGGEGHLEEARRLARLRHPNVIAVHGAEVHDGWAGIWTDLVRGETLDSLLGRDGPFPRDLLLRVSRDLCRALGAVHGAKLVHGDVKPSNVMQDGDGRIVLMDFGSGRGAHESIDEDGEPGATARPQGTPVAMAPELFRGTSPSPATDIYAVGVLLYRLASGQYPIRARRLSELSRAVFEETPAPMSELRPDLPLPFARVVHRALAREASDRPHSAEELGWALAAALGEDVEPAARTEALEDELPGHAEYERFNTRFVGRSEDLRLLRTGLIDPGLVTIIGPGGSGKTRLAARVTTELARSLPGGATWVELAPVSDLAGLIGAVARAAGLRDTAQASVEQSLREHFADRPALLVWDNAEHLCAEAAQLAAPLLMACPRLHLLVTSRQRLGVDHERVLSVPPMAVPPEGAEGIEIIDSDAVRLFVNLAQRGSESVRLTAHTAPDIARIVRRVEGIPLAIELAAARVPSLGLAAVATRLEESFRLLASREPAGSARHSTVSASIRWSYDLLDPEERVLFARLAVFSGGWGLDAAEAVCADVTSGSNEARVGESELVDLLSSLAERSLVSVDRIGEGETRFRFLETVRAFALERFGESGDAEQVRDRHLEWCEREALVHAEGIHGEEVERHVAWFDREQPNFRAAHQRLGTLIGSGRASGDRWLTFCRTIRAYWANRGALREGLEMLSLALEASPAITRDRGIGLALLAWLQLAMGDPRMSVETAMTAVAIGRELQDEGALGSGLSSLALACVEAGEYVRARAAYIEALELRQRPEHARFASSILCNLGVLDGSIGDHDAAEVWFQRALAIAEPRRDDLNIALVLSNLAHSRLEVGRFSEARPLAEQGFAAGRRSGNVGSLCSAALALILVETRDGRLAEAREHLLEPLGRMAKFPHVLSWLQVMDAAVELFLARSQHEAAAAIWGSMEATRQRSGLPASPLDARRFAARVESLRNSMGAEGWGAATAGGRLLSPAEAVQFVLRNL